MQIKRNRERIVVEIPVIVTSVLDNLEGTIVDLTEGGAQIVGCALPARSQCQIDLDGSITFGTVQWSEIDRMGIRFPYELTGGPLLEKLEMARAAQRGTMNPQAQNQAPVRSHSPAAGGFGRRIV